MHSITRHADLSRGNPYGNLKNHRRNCPKLTCCRRLTAFDGRMTAYAPIIQSKPNPESESNNISTELMCDCRTASAACSSFSIVTEFFADVEKLTWCDPK